jgi:hypothetical protein
VPHHRRGIVPSPLRDHVHRDIPIEQKGFDSSPEIVQTKVRETERQAVMADTANSEKLVFSLRGDVTARCETTARLYEVGSGALSHAEQTANFVRERDLVGTRPKPGERCAQTGREYECGSGSLSRERQTANFLNDLSAAEKAQRKASLDALVAATPAGAA